MLKLRARWSYDSAGKQLRLDLEQLQPGPPYRMPIELGLEFDSQPNSSSERIEVRQRRETLRLPLDRQPKSLTLDPRTFVLMDADVARADAP